jgi:hypothetical protein
MPARGITVDVVDSRAWFAAPTPADAVLLAHLSFYWLGFSYRRYVRAVLDVMHDPDEVSTFTDRPAWHHEPIHEVPTLAAIDRVLTCSRETIDVLRTRYGFAPSYAATFPHDAAAVRAAADARRRATADGARTPVRFVTAAFGPERAGWHELVARLGAPRFCTRDERGRVSWRQLRSVAIRRARKNTPCLRHLAGTLAADPRAVVDIRVGAAPALPEAEYYARLAAGDVNVCTSMMEGGPLPDGRSAAARSPGGRTPSAPRARSTLTAGRRSCAARQHPARPAEPVRGPNAAARHQAATAGESQDRHRHSAGDARSAAALRLQRPTGSARGRQRLQGS